MSGVSGSDWSAVIAEGLLLLLLFILELIIVLIII